MSIFTFYIF